MPQVNLAQAASGFASEIQELLDAVLPGERQIRAVQSVQFSDRYVVRPEGPDLDAAAIPLFVAGEPLARLRLSFQCCADHQGAYLAVERSEFILVAQADREPLVRLEFRRDAYRAPAAHWQVHAERGAFSALLARAKVKAPHDLASLHLPVGGPRMRPGLEDFLEFLVRECSFDHCGGWQQAVEASRQNWRRRQVATLVRDAPEEAIRVLTENGYRVEPSPSASLPGRPESLRAW